MIRHDRKGKFRFASLQSEAGKALQEKFNFDPAVIDTIILIENDRAYTRSTGVLRIARHLGGIFPAAYIFIVVPVFIRDFVYKIVARNRYRWFGHRDECMIPTPELRERFLL
jgi:predicted DCC family thiol-disulfide oxidoreductase YuxK